MESSGWLPYRILYFVRLSCPAHLLSVDYAPFVLYRALHAIFHKDCRCMKKGHERQAQSLIYGRHNQGSLKQHLFSFLSEDWNRKNCMIFVLYHITWYSYYLPPSPKRSSLIPPIFSYVFFYSRQRLQLPKMYNQKCIDWITQFSCLVASWH